VPRAYHSSSIVSNENEPATRKDLAELAADLTAKMATKDDLARLATKDDLARLATKDDLARLATKDDLAALEKRLLFEIGHVVNVVIEQIGAKVAIIDDKYDGPVRQVRTDLDGHRADFSLHTRPVPSPPKRTRRRKPPRAR
jgi:hypothetical protein